MPVNKTRRIPVKLRKKWVTWSLAKRAAYRQTLARQEAFKAHRMSRRNALMPKAKSKKEPKNATMRSLAPTRRSTRPKTVRKMFDPAEEERRQREEQEIARGQAEFLAQERARKKAELNAINSELAGLMGRFSGLGKPIASVAPATTLGRGSRSF